MDPDEIDARVNGLLGAGTAPTATSAATGSTTGPTYGPFQEEAEGVPSWLAAEYRQAQQEYAAAVVAVQNSAGDPLGASAAKARLDAARQNLNNIRSSLDNFKANAAKTKPAPVADWKPYYDPRTMRREQDPTTGQWYSTGDVIGMQDPNTGTVQMLPKGTGPATAADLATQAYTEAVNKAKLADLQTYGLAGRPKATEPSASLLDLYWRQQRYPEEQAESKRRWEATYEAGQAAAAATERRAREAQEAAERRALMDREAEDVRNRRTATVNLSGDIGQQQARMLPYAVDPSWTSYPGFEAGGSYEQLVKMGGGTYTPYKIPRQEFDPLQAWRSAQGLLGVK